MRILFSSGPLYGHVNTVLPLALAAQRAGHQVVLATGPDLVARVEQRGLRAWSVGVSHAQAGGSAHDSWLNYFAVSAERRAVDLVPRAIAWKPDLVIHEETELAGFVAAAACKARCIVHGLGVMPSARIWPLFVAAIERLGLQWKAPGIAGALGEAIYLHICPPALQSPGERIWTRVLPLRPAMGMPAEGEGLPDALDALPHERSIHLTLGTVFNGATRVLECAMAGLRDLPFNLVVTTGPGIDPARFGPQPAHVRIERYIPHALLLPRCSLVVSQGGAGIMFGALGHGLPQLILPQGGDQFANAQACCRSRAALSLVRDEVSAEAVATAALRLLREPAYGVAARAVRSEIDAMPDAGAMLAVIARLTRT